MPTLDDASTRGQPWRSMPPREAALACLAALAAPDDHGLRDEAFRLLPRAVWQWGAAFPDDALRLACELAQPSPAPSDPAHLVGGVAYLASTAARGACPFTIQVDSELQYDDEGGDYVSYVAGVSTRAGCSFPSGVDRLARDAFSELVFGEDWEFKMGSHDGLSFLLDNWKDFQFHHSLQTGHEDAWAKLIPVLEGACLAGDLRNDLPAGTHPPRRKPL